MAASPVAVSPPVASGTGPRCGTRTPAVSSTRAQRPLRMHRCHGASGTRPGKPSRHHDSSASAVVGQRGVGGHASAAGSAAAQFPASTAATMIRHRIAMAARMDVSGSV